MLWANPKQLQSLSFPSAHKGRAKSNSRRQGLGAQGLDPRVSTRRRRFYFHALVAKPRRLQILASQAEWSRNEALQGG